MFSSDMAIGEALSLLRRVCEDTFRFVAERQVDRSSDLSAERIARVDF